MIALSIRQPWAWLIVNAAKDVENRTWPTLFRGNCLIHAGKTMTRAEYDAAAEFVLGLPPLTLPPDFEFPTFEYLKTQCGGVVGRMRISGCVPRSESPWFVGPYGFVIDGATSETFRPFKGALGFFNIQDPVCHP